MIYKILLFWSVSILLILVYSTLLAQEDFTAFSLCSDFFPPAKLETSIPQNEDMETELSTLLARFAYPAVFNRERTIWINGLSFDRLQFRYQNANLAAANIRPDNLYALKYEMIVRNRLSEKFYLTVLAQPGISSDLEDVSSSDVNFQGGLLFDRQAGQRAAFGLGVVYLNDFGEPQFLPAVRFKYNNKKNLRINIFLPRLFSIWYMPFFNRQYSIGAVSRVSGNHYRIGKEIDFPNNGGTTKNGRIKYSVVTIGPAIKFHILQGFSLLLEGGSAVERRFQIFDGDGSKRITLDLKNKYYIRIGFKAGR